MTITPHERAQVRALHRAFLVRFFENEITSGTDDLKASFIWLLSFLAVPGVFLPMSMGFVWQLIALKHGPEAVRIATRGDKAFYLGFTMIATASVATIAWTSLLADRRDGLVLGVLPVRPIVVVVARLGALASYVGLLAVGMNLLASVSFGVGLAGGSVGLLRGVMAHLVASVGASACVFLCITGAQGVVLATLGPRVFQRMAPLMQITLVGLIVVGFLALPVIDVSVVPTLAKDGHDLRPWILSTPPLWFLGLYEVILGTSDPVLTGLATKAGYAFVAGLLATGCSYPFAYRRVMLAAVQEGGDSRHEPLGRSAARLLASSVGRASGIRAVSQFFFATLGRVERHRFIVAASIGVVIAWVLPGSISVLSTRPDSPRVELLALPLAAMVFLVCGLRIAASIPADPGAGWLFDVTPPPRRHARAAVERTMIGFCVVPVALAFAPLYRSLWGGRVALSHTAVSIAMGVLLVEVALWRVHAVPCVQSWNPQAENLGRRWWAYLVGFLMFTVGVSTHEVGLFGDTFQITMFVAAIVVTALVVRFLSLRQRIVVDDRSAFAPGDVLSLN